MPTCRTGGRSASRSSPRIGAPGSRPASMSDWPRPGRGRPAHKPIVTPAVLPATVQAPSQDVITRALGALGIAGIDRWLRDGRALVFPSPVREDGPGWRAEVDLPYGVTAAMVTERR